MALGPKVVDLVGLHLLDDAHQVGRVSEIPVVKNKPLLRVMRVLVQVIYPVGVKKRRPPLDAVDNIAIQQDRRRPGR